MDFAALFNDIVEFAKADPIHIMLIAAFIGLLVLLIANEVSRFTRGIKELLPAQVVGLMNKSANVVDIRDNSEYNKTHIVNAINIPLAQIEKKSGQLDKDTPVVVYCGMGNTAIKAATQLKKLGFNEVFMIKGGLQNWQEDKLPVVNAKSKKADKKTDKKNAGKKNTSKKNSNKNNKNNNAKQ